VSQQVLHLDFIGLAPETTQEQRSQLEDSAAKLIELDQLIGVGVIDASAESDFDVAFYFLLADFTDLEPFGTDPRYVRFLQGNVAPVLRAFAGADVKLDGDFEIVDGPVACVALTAPEETYDWEVREALEAWAASLNPVASAIGVAVGERQRFRGVGIAFGAQGDGVTWADDGPFTPTLIAGSTRRLG
jgi:hypothetical protein